jgi:hypothetical protein
MDIARGLWLGAKRIAALARLKSYNLADFGRLPQCTNRARQALSASPGPASAPISGTFAPDIAFRATRPAGAQIGCLREEPGGTRLHRQNGKPI